MKRKVLKEVGELKQVKAQRVVVAAAVSVQHHSITSSKEQEDRDKDNVLAKKSLALGKKQMRTRWMKIV